MDEEEVDILETAAQVYSVQTDFPFIEIPEELYPIVGKPDPGTRLYRRDGSQEEASVWFELLTEIIGPSVSPGGAGMYCPVSRAAVYKRVKEGKLSMFLFHVTWRQTTLFGKNKILRENPYGYIPASELRAWRDELEKRAVERGNITLEDLEGSKPDWNGEFLEWRNKKERMGGWVDPETGQNILLEMVKVLAKSLVTPKGEPIVTVTKAGAAQAKLDGYDNPTEWAKKGGKKKK